MPEILRDIWEGLMWQLRSDFWVDAWPVVVASILYFGIGYALLRVFADPGDDRGRAWFLSILSSGFLFSTCTPFSIYWIYLLWVDGFEIGTRWMLNSLPYADSLVIFFLTFLWSDLLVSKFFPGHMELCAGYIHHILYIILSSNGLLWGWTNGLCIMFVEELPTLILSLGMAYPGNLKSETGFGYTFAIFRLGYHSFASILITIYTRHESSLYIAAWLAFAVHSWWFFGWIKRQRKINKAKQGVKNLLDMEQPEKAAMLTNKIEKVQSSRLRLDSLLIDDPQIDDVDKLTYDSPAFTPIGPLEDSEKSPLIND